MFQIKEDIRIKNTKSYVYKALIELLKNKPYENITISMIINKSGVSRTTFYRHFYTKDDILISKLKEQSFDLISLMNEQYDFTVYNKNVFDKVKFFFAYWDKNPELIELLIDLDKTSILYTNWSSLLVKMFTGNDIAIASYASELYTAHFCIGGLTSLIIQWFKKNLQVGDFFIEFIIYSSR